MDMTPHDTDRNTERLVAEGRVVHLCEGCGETFETGRDLLHVTCPSCGTDAVDAVARV